MIYWQCRDNRPVLGRHNRPTISNVADIAHVIDQHSNNRTRSRLVSFQSILYFAFWSINELPLRLCKSLQYWCLRIYWKWRLFDDLKVVRFARVQCDEDCRVRNPHRPSRRARHRFRIAHSVASIESSYSTALWCSGWLPLGLRYNFWLSLDAC